MSYKCDFSMRNVQYVTGIDTASHFCVLSNLGGFLTF
jgi:hypothetical protein